MIISIYVGDCLIVGFTLQKVLKAKRDLSNRFKMHVCDEAKTCVELKIDQERSVKTTKICQKNYALKLLPRRNAQNFKAVGTSMICQIDAEMPKGGSFQSIFFRQAIVILIYLMVCTRANLAFAVGRLSQHTKHPTLYLRVCLRRVL